MNMKLSNDATMLADNRLMQWVYSGTIFLMVVTGFGQMPLYKRYYVSDIPGLGWLADFWMTRYVHSAGAALLLGILAYAAIEFLAARRKDRRLTPSGAVRSVLLSVMVVTGILLIVKNFSIFFFAPAFIVFLDLCHLGSVMAFLMAGLYCLVFKKQWTSPR